MSDGALVKMTTPGAAARIIASPLRVALPEVNVKIKQGG
jgi:hypothetical protein